MEYLIFRFPKDPARRKLWQRNVRRDKWVPTKNSVICSKHFQNEDFQPTAEHRQKRELKQTALPTIFDFPEHLQPKK